MGVLNINADDFNIRLGDTLKDIGLCIDYDRTPDWMEFGAQQDYIRSKKEELKQRIRDLQCGCPKGSDLRKCIWETFGIWLSVRSAGKLAFREDAYLAKYYEIKSASVLDPCGNQFKEFCLKGKDDITYRRMDIWLIFETKAPYDGYKF